MSGPGADGAALLELVGVIRRLRAECPWYVEQTHESLIRFLLEESYEVIDALDGTDEQLREELGDLLLQVVLHAAIAEEQGRFDIEDVAAGIAAKMRRRNPHVFGPAPVEGLSAAEVDAQYQAIKATEKAAGAAGERHSSARPSGDLLILLAEVHRAGVDPEQVLRDALRAPR